METLNRKTIIKNAINDMYFNIDHDGEELTWTPNDVINELKKYKIELNPKELTQVYTAWGDIQPCDVRD